MHIRIKYYSVLQYDCDSIYIFFPDIPCAYTCAYDKYEAILMAKEVLMLTLHETRINDLPKSSTRESIHLNENQRICKIEVTMEVKEGKLIDNDTIEFKKM